VKESSRKWENKWAGETWQDFWLVLKALLRFVIVFLK
jgi:hypothetical protein